MRFQLNLCLSTLLLLQEVLGMEETEGEGNFSVTFDNNFVGVAFSPYVKDWEGDNTPQWDSYSVEEIQIMLKLVSTKFRHISTYGMGVSWFLDYESAQDVANKTWEEVDSNGKISQAAALLNRETDQLSISVSQGIFQIENFKLDNFEAVQNKEIDLAFVASVNANKLYPGTVWGLTFTNNYVTDVFKGRRLLNMILANKSRAKEHNLKVGIRINNCIDLVNHGPNEKIIAQIIVELDYVMCILHPKQALIKKGSENAVLEVGKLYLSIRTAIKFINLDVEVIIGETGWPSKGKSYNDSPNNIQNLKSYWLSMGKWAKENKVKVQMFEAFDEPWKSDVKILDSNNPGGIFGAERHYGWWRRKSNDDMETYIQKMYEEESSLIIKNNNESESHQSNFTIIIVSVGIVLLAISIVVGFVIKYYASRHQKPNQFVCDLTDADINDFQNGYTPSAGDKNSYEFLLTMPYNQEYEMQKKDFEIYKESILGRGNFGLVYKGKIKGVEEDVAFKTTRDTTAGILKSLLTEIKIMAYIGKHPNVVSLIGAYTTEVKQGILYIASEFCELGSLEDYLRNNALYFLECNESRGNSKETKVHIEQIEILGSKCFGILDLIKWSYEIAIAMEHLENKKVIHADIATRNVLLTIGKTAKITDFGLSRRMYEYTQYVKKNQEPLPWRWMALETLLSMTFSSKSDVWSFGVTLWEIFSLAAIPYPGLAWHIDFITDLENGLRPRRPKYASEIVFHQMSLCWEAKPEERPDFKINARFFKNLLSSSISNNSVRSANHGDNTSKDNGLHTYYNQFKYPGLRHTNAYENNTNISSALTN